MQIELHRPPAPLSRYIDSLWHLRDAPSHAREQIVPGGTVELVINLHDDRFTIHHPHCPQTVAHHSGAMVSGTYGRSFIIDARQHASVIGVHFKPGGATAVLGIPSNLLADRHVDLEHLWTRSAAVALRERLCAAQTTAARFDILQAALLQRLLRARSAHPAIAWAVQAIVAGPRETTVQSLAQQANLSQRHFISRFTAEVGLTPKHFMRVGRFRRAMSLSNQPNAPQWAEVAVACGYFDQSHLIRDFQEFAGLTPTQFRQRATTRVKQDHIAVAP